MVKSFKTNLLSWLKTKTYIKTEIDNFLNGKSNSNHNHNSTYSLLNHQHAGLNDKVDIICRSGGQQTTTGYRKVFRLKITNQYFDAPVSFEFVQRKSRQTARVHIIFNSVTSTDPPLRGFTYDGAIEQPIYLYKESASNWVFIFKEQSNYDTVNIRFLPLSSSIKDSCTITPINEFLSDLPTDDVQVGSMISATSTRTGYMDYRDKIKLDGIDDGANKTIVDSSLSSSSTNPVQNKVINTALNRKSNTGHEHTSDEIHYAYDQNVSVTTILENKAAKNHTHDDRYYTETEMNTKLNGKANSSHTHNISDVTGLSTSLDGKMGNNYKVSAVTGADNMYAHRIGDIVIVTWWNETLPTTQNSWVDWKTLPYQSCNTQPIWVNGDGVGCEVKVRVPPNSNKLQVNINGGTGSISAGMIVYPTK